LAHASSNAETRGAVRRPFDNQPCEALYALHKKFAWVDVEKQWYGLAGVSAEEAILANPNGSAAYCLLAQLETAKGRKTRQRRIGEKCVANNAARRQIRLSRHFCPPNKKATYPLLDRVH
jgi:hypothetical protein